VTPMDVELLYWEGCPSHPAALDQLRVLLAELGRDPDTVRRVEVETDEQAARERFPGSPTIRVDGRDLFPPGEGDPLGLTCRVYRLRDGRFSPIPDPDDLRDALRRALEDQTG
jgi:hypothetical protein